MTKAIVVEATMSNNTQKPGHDYHLIDPSPWPILLAFTLLMTASGGIMTLHNYPFGAWVFGVGLLSVTSVAISWWRDVIKEGLVDKAHTPVVRQGLRFGMAFFILSELMFFFAFFYSFFHAKIFPADILDGVWAVKEGIWPPEGIQAFDPWHLPFMNTLILLLSGTTVTWAHHAARDATRNKEVITALGLTILLGISFTCLQALEYAHAPFAFKQGIFASNFYMATGFHGLHVIIGTLFLAVCWFRARKKQFTPEGHLGLEFAAWYWHFVDVVWLFLFAFVYIWGGQ